MFWIGMIVGAIIWTLICIAILVYCCKSCGVSRAEFNSMVDTVSEAVENRASEIQVWHDGMLIDVTYLEER